MIKIALLLLCISFLGLIFRCDAQNTLKDSSSQQYAFNNAVSVLNSSVGNESSLYNGPEYYNYSPLIKGNACFLDINSFAQGSVNYNGVFFSEVPMLYDLYKDEVVVLLYNHFSKFSLIKEKVKDFDLAGHHFINIDADTLGLNPNMKSGFYDDLYAGKLTIFSKYSKDIQVNTASQNVESYFNTKKTEYFVKKNGRYYSYSSLGSLLDILIEHKKEIQQYIKANNIKYRKNPEEAMVAIAKFYDQIN